MLTGTLLAPAHLTEQQTQAVEARFAELLGEQVRLEEKLDASLIGGICVTVGGRIYDGSIRARLHDVARLIGTGEEAGSNA